MQQKCRIHTKGAFTRHMSGKGPFLLLISFFFAESKNMILVYFNKLILCYLSGDKGRDSFLIDKSFYVSFFILKCQCHILLANLL